MKIDFFCIGVQKAGTTSLHDILSVHPQIFLPKEKEANFFDVDELYVKGLNWYHSYFYKYKKDEKIIGNINPNLQLDRKSIIRILEAYGKSTQIILILRNPVDRAYSHFLMSKKRGYEKKNFLTALKEERERLRNPKPHYNYYTEELGHFEKNHFGYIYRSLYAELIKFLLSHISKDNLKIILFEQDFIENRKDTISSILNFLNVEDSCQGININIKSNRAKISKSPFIRDFLYQSHFIKDILKKIIPSWRIRYRLKQKIDFLNSRPMAKGSAELPISIKKQLFNTYFKDDVAQLEVLLNRELKNWYNFNE